MVLLGLDLMRIENEYNGCNLNIGLNVSDVIDDTNLSLHGFKYHSMLVDTDETSCYTFWLGQVEPRGFRLWVERTVNLITSICTYFIPLDGHLCLLSSK